MTNYSDFYVLVCVSGGWGGGGGGAYFVTETETLFTLNFTDPNKLYKTAVKTK